MATLTVQDVSTAGLEATYAAAAGGGDQFANDGKTLIHVKNGSVGDITVTIVSQRACDQGSTHNTAVVVTAAEERFIGPFEVSRYNDASGFVQLTYSGVTSLTIRPMSV
jgi:hypothetical protein